MYLLKILYWVSFVLLWFFFYNFSSILVFLVNYHIYCIYIIILVLLVYTNYFFFLKYQYIYLYSYIYIYWFVCINTLYLNLYFLWYIYSNIYNFFIFKMSSRLNFFILDTKNSFIDLFLYFSGFVSFLTKPQLFLEKFKVLFTQLNDRRKYILKKYVYTINHKRIAIN